MRGDGVVHLGRGDTDNLDETTPSGEIFKRKLGAISEQTGMPRSVWWK